MEQHLRRAAVWFVNVAAVCLGLSACQTAVVAPTWTIPPGVSTQIVNDYPLAYTARGSGPTIVFLHGALVDYRYWQDPLDAWTADFRVIAVSMRHFYPEKWDGKGSDFTIRQHARDLIAFIESTGGPVYLVGWSYGGSPAYEVARARPDLVKKLVLVEGGPDLRATPPGVPGNADQIRRASNTAKFFDAGDIDGGLQFVVDDINGSELWSKLPDAIRQVLRDNAWTVVGLRSRGARHCDVRRGGLLSYGINFPAAFRRAAEQVGLVLNGAKPAAMPVEQSTVFELVINMKTAKARGLTIPPSILLRADEVIQ